MATRGISVCMTFFISFNRLVTLSNISIDVSISLSPRDDIFV